MNSLIRYLSFLLFALIMVFSTAKAAEMPAAPPVRTTDPTELDITEPMIMPPQQNSFPFGQSHRYSVVFRGNGEAVVTLNTAISNTTDQPLSQLKFRVPQGIPSDLIAYQVIGQRQCIQYDYKTRTAPEISYESRPLPCLQYQEPDFNQYVGGYNLKYQKATANIETDTIIVTLPQPIKVNGVGGIMMYYRSGGYTTKDVLGGYGFTFETLKVEDKIQQLQVGISTDSELILKGTRGSVNYRFTDTAGMMKAESAAGIAAPIANAQFDSFYRQIGQGSIVKTSSNLQPLDSYTVKGNYAASNIQLYGKELIIAGVVVIVFLLIISLLVRFLVIRLKKPTAKNDSAIHPLIVSSISSFGSALVVVLYTIVLIFLTRSLTSYISYDLEGLVIALLLVVSFGVYGFLLFTAPIVIGIKRGIGWGAATLGFTIGWVTLFIIFILVFFFITRGTSSIYPPVYPMRASSGIAVPDSSVDLGKAVEN